MLPNRKILVTGGAGFIGSHVCQRLLEQGCRVISVDNFNHFYDPRIKFDNINAIALSDYRENFFSLNEDIRRGGEILKIFERENPDAVIHLAAMAGVRPSIENPLLYSSVNIEGTQNVLEACAEVGIRHFLFASSSSVYGNNPKIPFSEEDNVDFPISPYAATKKAGELFCHTYAHLYGMAITALRFFTVYGPRQRPDLAIHQFAKLIYDDKEIPFFGDGTSERDYTYIDDIVDGVLSALEVNLEERKKSFEIINLGGSQAVSLNEMVSTLEEAFHKKARRKMLPNQPGDVKRTFADIRKAKKILGFSPSTPFQEGIKNFVSWFLESKNEMRIPA